MANELKFGNKVVFLGGNPITLASASADPGSAVNGDMYYNTTSNVVRVYQNGSWQSLATGGAAANTSLSNLSAVAINASLLPGVDNSIDLGSAAKSWANAYIHTLLDGSSVSSVSPYLRQLNDSSGNLSVDWENRVLSDGTLSRLEFTSSGVKFSQLTASTVPYLDANKFLVSSAVTPTELGYLSGATSSIQTQINAKANDNIVIKKDGSVAYVANQPMGGFKLTGLAAGSGAGDSVRYEQAILTSGANAFAANQSFGSFNATNLADPVSAQDAATKAYVDGLIDGRDWKQSVKAATTAAGTLATDFENGDSIDGVTLSTGDRILIKDQAAGEENGIYIVQATGAPVRASDANTALELTGAAVFVEQGTVNADKQFAQTADNITLDTTPLVWVVTSANSFSGHDMITLSGGQISVDLAAVSGLESSNPGNAAGQLRVKLEASNPSLRITGSNELAVKFDPAGAITSGASGILANVDNTTIEIATNALQLKAGGITNTHINASAAIALTKLAAVTANRALASDASGFIVASTVTDTELGYLSGVTSAIQTQLNGKASTALDNLAAVAINTSLVSDTDNTDDLGSDSIEWKDVWAYNLKHNSAGTPNLGIMTTGNNGSIVMTAHGTGNLDILATKLRRSESGASSQYMEDQYFDALTLAANTSSDTEISSSLSFPAANFDGAVINYRIKEATSNKVRIGQFYVSSDGTVASSSDQFSETALLGSALGLSFNADVNAGNVRILYNNTHASNSATMRCQIRRFRA